MALRQISVRLFLFSGVQCVLATTLVTKPTDTVLIEENFVIMSCTSNYSKEICGKITWWYYKVGSYPGYGDRITTDGSVLPSYASYISVIDSKAGHCDLSIKPNSSVAGRYECDDTSDKALAALIVLGETPFLL